MSDKHHLDQPPNPARRRLFTLFTDRKAAGEIGAELGKIYHEAQEAAHELAQVGQEMTAALTDAVAPSEPSAAAPTPPDFAQPSGDDEREIEAAVELAEQIAALGKEEAANAEQTHRLLELVAEQVQRLNTRIDALQQSSDPQAQAKARRLDKVRAGLWAAISGGLGYLVTRTGEALYDGWVQENLLPLLPEWVQRPWEAFARGEQPASPAVKPISPLAAPEESPLPAPQPQVLRINYASVLAPEIVYVPAGWFLMGSDKCKDPQAEDDELPQHWVWLDAYWIGKYPITNEQYAAFVRATGHVTPWGWYGVIPKGKESHPVVDVSWHDARAYCNWLGMYTRRSYRLPSEAEWEKAARGIDGRIYPWGSQPPDAQLCNSAGRVGDTTPVDAYPAGASPYGALDMVGNVWEWTNTIWGIQQAFPAFNYPYTASDGRERLDGPPPGRCVLRGGTFRDMDPILRRYTDRRVRCAARHSLISDLSDGDFGFRVVLSPSISAL